MWGVDILIQFPYYDVIQEIVVIELLCMFYLKIKNKILIPNDEKRGNQQ